MSKPLDRETPCGISEGKYSITPGDESARLCAVSPGVRSKPMEYDFLVDTYESERLKTLSVWSTLGMKSPGSAPPAGQKGQERVSSTWCTSA